MKNKVKAKSNTLEQQRGLMLKIMVSQQLQELLGAESDVMTRPELNSLSWVYFKKHGLQDPVNKRYILSDANLLNITGGIKRFVAFGFQKAVAKHIRPL